MQELPAVITDVITDVADATLILDRVQGWLDGYFKRVPDAAKQADVAKAMDVTRSSLNVLLRSTQGAKDIDQGKLDQAKNDFKSAYANLEQLLATLGVHTAGQEPGGLGMSEGGLVIPKPLLLEAGR